ncbi:MAG: portal protein, partial [Fusobacteriaceae bacterium]
RKGLLSGKMKALRIEKPIRIEFVPFADMFVTGQHENIKDARYVCQRVCMTVGEAMELGYDFDKLATASQQQQNSGQGFLSNQKLVNFETFGEDEGMHILTADPLERNIYLYEHYMYSSLVDKSKRKSKLYRIVSTDVEILEVEEVARIPFVHGKMESVPGSFWGRSMYDKLGPIQDIITRLVRAAEYNAADGAYGRYIAVKGMYDRASLLNNRPGSVIEVNPEAGAAAVQRFSKEDLPVSADALVQRLTQSYKEDAMSFVGVDVSGSGISATAAAITANSADLKDKVIARTLSYTLFRPLFEGIYDIIVTEDLQIGEIPNPQVAQAQAGVEAGELPQEVLMEIPQTLPIRGADLPPVSDFVIDVNTANDDAMLNSQLLNLMTMMAQLPPGLVNVQEIAAQFTGMPVHLVAKFFPAAPAPSEEDMALEQAQKEMALEQGALQLEMMKGEMTKLAAETFEIEKKVELNVAESEAVRLRDEEKSIREFKVLEMKEKELDAEMSGNQIQISNYTR